ncbi:uncharacterized protein LOC123550187 [Mercenaria mercenaria]|uniref:uncharacterized protein LOC123550187 n=1 Tax=Mercenaria mercenaria TaxID=6596 RepID=UPI00234F2CA5|nr:uncharacterized protein LOC123550187 [Mercenaria mercenaria]XP_045194565.2 uncharacterized protein LOC123550187 [Mercenaria mercenaria]
MLQSFNLDSIPDDALFESGTEGWNQNSSQGSSVTRQHTLGDRTNTMTLQNQEETRNMPGIGTQGHQRINTERQDSRRQQVFQPVTRSSSPPEALLAVFDASSDQVQSHSTVSRQELGNGGARAKTTKNKENRNKNSAIKRNGFVVNANNEDRSRRVQSQNKTFSPDWEPHLQLKRYDDEDDLTGSDTTCRKVVNQSKQRKQNINKNAMKNQTVRVPQSGNINNDSLMSLASIPLPAGLDPVSNPRNIDHIYLKNVTNPQQNREVAPENDLETDFFSVHHKDNSKVQNASQKILDKPNISQIHNNLWDEQNKEKNRGNQNITHIRMDQPRNNTVQVVQNMPQERSTTVLKLTNPLSLPRALSDSGLKNASIPVVVPYELSSSADNLMQMNSTSASAGSSPHSLVSTVSFNTSPTSTLANSLITDPLNLSDSLSSNLSSNILFGDGVSNDYLYAQKLQQEYDRENEALQRRRQYDILPDQRAYLIPAEEHFNQQLSHIPAPSAGDQYNSQDFITANEYQVMNDSLTNDIEPVYDPQEDDRVPQNHDPIYIPLESEVETVQETEEDVEENARPGRSEVVIPQQIQADEQYPETFPSREPIVVRYDEGSDRITQPEHSPEMSDSLVARGGAKRQSLGHLDDAEYARRIQEQQDEEFARMLQEQESEDDHHHSNMVNLATNFEQNNTRRNYQPLHTRFGHTWTNRPLRVGPPIGGAANNVADSRVRSRNTWDRPLLQRQDDSEFAYLDNVHSLSINEGYDIPPGQDYYYRYQNDPDYMLDENGEDRLISINRDPQLLATLLMTRAPDMMIPNHIDLNDYEALWELAENLGEVRRVGMDENDISLLPVHTYKTPTSGESENNKTDCLVCLSEFSDGERLRTLPCCHIYHIDCIDEWLRRNAICPVCRQPAVQRQ